jgi:hypothetical protein
MLVRCDRTLATTLASAEAAGIRCACRSLSGVRWRCAEAPDLTAGTATRMLALKGIEQPELAHVLKTDS